MMAHREELLKLYFPWGKKKCWVHFILDKYDVNMFFAELQQLGV